MSDLLSKLSSYNIFNYLLPGVVFSIIADGVTSFKFIQPDVLVGAFSYYFIGLIISRVGSVILEPAVKKLGIIRFSEYSHYVDATKKDELIITLSEQNNMYRTFCSVFFCLLLVMAYDYVAVTFHVTIKTTMMLFSVVMILMFLFSYRKQTNYITKRVAKVVSSSQKE